MHRHFLAILFVAFAGLTACSPGFNWRDVPLPPANGSGSPMLMALLPCKPDRASRSISFEGGALDVQMAGCTAQGVTFTLARADVADPARRSLIMQQWQASTRAQVQAGSVSEIPFALRSSSGPLPLARMRMAGHAADGGALIVNVVWFAHGGAVFQAAIYEPAGTPLAPDAVQSFFSGLYLP